MLAVISMVDICSISDIRASNASSYRFIQNSLHFLESHIVPEQYSIQKKYPKHSVSRKSHLTYTNVRNTFQTNQNLGALWENADFAFSNELILCFLVLAGWLMLWEQGSWPRMKLNPLLARTGVSPRCTSTLPPSLSSAMMHTVRVLRLGILGAPPLGSQYSGTLSISTRSLVCISYCPRLIYVLKYWNKYFWVFFTEYSYTDSALPSEAPVSSQLRNDARRLHLGVTVTKGRRQWNVTWWRNQDRPGLFVCNTD